MNKLVIPILATAGVLGLLYASRSEAAPPPRPNYPPLPQPQPQPPFPPIDPSGASGPALLEQFRSLLAQVALNPLSVDPRQIGLLAAKLRDAGRVAEATQLETTVGPAVCAARGLPGNCWTIAVTGTASQVPASLYAEIQRLLNPNDPTINSVQVDTQVASLKMNFPNQMLTQVSQLERRAKELRDLGR